jgi:hypothetical protein
VLRPGEGTAGPSPECYGRAVKLELMVEMGIRARLRQGAHQERPTKAPLAISPWHSLCVATAKRIAFGLERRKLRVLAPPANERYEGYASERSEVLGSMSSASVFPRLGLGTSARAATFCTCHVASAASIRASYRRFGRSISKCSPPIVRAIGQRPAR